MLEYRGVIKLFRYNRETGVLYWRKRTNPKQRASLEAGCLNSSDGYITVGINGKMYAIHRVIMLMEFGFYGEGYEVDHINHIRSDNRFNNLRFVTVKGNRRNQSVSSKSTTGVTGVYLNKKRGIYAAQIKVDGKVYYLGSYPTLEEAAEVRKQSDIKFKFNANHGSNKAEYVRTKSNA